MSALPERLARLVDLVTSLPDRADRIEILIDTAGRFRGVPESIARRPYPDAHRTPACESEVFVFAEPLGGDTLRFHFAVENPQGISAKALAVVLSEGLEGASIEQLAALDDEFVSKLFGGELSMGKSMGLTGMVAMVRETARRALAARVENG